VAACFKYVQCNVLVVFASILLLEESERCGRLYDVETHSLLARTAGSEHQMNAIPHPLESTVHILRLPQVRQVTGLCRSMIYQLEAERRFPHRVRIGVRAVGWVESEVQAWLAIRIERNRA
jgi:prophage regulatory protein